MSHGVSKVFVSAIVRNKRIPESLLDEINEKISFMCKTNNFIFVDNSIISNIHLFDDDLYLLESERRILANNVIDRINNSLLTHLHHPDMQISDLQILFKVILKYPRNSLIGYLNINSLTNKIIGVREMIGRLQLDYFVISKTKLDSSFPSAQFHPGHCEIRNRRDRDKSKGGLIEFVKKGIITKRL